MSLWYRALLCLSCMLAPQLAHAQQAPVIELDGPSKTPVALFVQELLEQAYGNIGYQVSYRSAPLARSFIEANTGRLDGLRARIGSVADKYPNLVKVPFRLLDFKLVSLADRRVCGACDLSQLSHIAVPRGFKAFEDFIAKQDFDLSITEVTSAQQALDILAAGKVQAVIMSDTNVPSSYYHLSHHWIKQTLAVLPDFHYLHNKHSALVPKLLAQLNQLNDSGYIKQLRKKHQVNELAQDLPELTINSISAVAGKWSGFTDSEKATYWTVLDRIYKSQVDAVAHKTTNWKRAKSLFASGESDILMGAYDFEISKGMLRSNIHIDYEWPVTAFAKDFSMLNRQLDGEVAATACYLLGYDFKEWLSSSIKAYEVADQNDCIRMLEGDRVDMLIDYDIDLPPSIVSNYSGQQIVGARPLFAVFHDNLRGKKLKRIFETEFRKLIINGQLKALFPDVEQFHLANFIVKDEFKVSQQ